MLERAFSWQVMLVPADYDRVEKHSLEIACDGRKKVLGIGKERFDLSKGNLFIVRADASWHFVAQQLPHNLEDFQESKAVMSTFQRLCPNQADVQSVDPGLREGLLTR